MAADFNLDLVGIEKIEGGQMGDVRLGSPGWRVTFSVATNRVTYDVAIFVEAGCPKE